MNNITVTLNTNENVSNTPFNYMNELKLCLYAIGLFSISFFFKFTKLCYFDDSPFSLLIFIN